MWAIQSKNQLEKTVAKTLKLESGETVKVTKIAELVPVATASSRVLSVSEKAADARRKLSKRSLSSQKELKVDFLVTLTENSPKNLIETKVMLLAAGGSSIT